MNQTPTGDFSDRETNGTADKVRISSWTVAGVPARRYVFWESCNSVSYARTAKPLAPTWSWASVVGGGFKSVARSVVPLCRILECHCTYLGPDSFGHVSSGRLTIYVIMAQVKIAEQRRKPLMLGIRGEPEFLRPIYIWNRDTQQGLTLTTPGTMKGLHRLDQVILFTC